MSETAPGEASIARSVTFDLLLPQETQERKPAIIASIRAYRAALRHCYGLLALAQSAGSELQWSEDDCRVKPGNHGARLIAALATGQSTPIIEEPAEPAERVRGEGDTYRVQLGRGAVYELRAEIARLLPSAMSFVLDSARRDLRTAWTSRDPQFGNASRGWLTLQGSRDWSRFCRRGIGLPRATARPKLHDYRLGLKWDRAIGEIEFKLPSLDASRRSVWRSLADGDDGWTLGTIYLTERDGDLKATVSYHAPRQAVEVDPARTLKVVVREEGDTLLSLSGPDGIATIDAIDRCEVRAFLQHQLARRIELEKRRGATGNPRRPWGYRKGFEVAQETLSRATLQRERGATERNHAWSRRIATRAHAWRCGVVEVGGFPSRSFSGGSPVGCIGDHPWSWSQFELFLRYKLEEIGSALIVSE